MVPKKILKDAKPLSFARANPWEPLPREVQVDSGNRDKKVGETIETPVDGHQQPKIYEIRDHTMEVLMHQSVLELHAVRVVRPSHGDEPQLHLKVLVMCGQKVVIADVLVDIAAQVSLVRSGLFPGTCLKSSDRPVCLKVASGGIIGGGAHEAEVGLEFWRHYRLDQREQAKRLMLHGRFYEAGLSYWDIIMSYDFMVSNSAGALPHRATHIREADERLSWLSTHYVHGGFHWTKEEEEKIVPTVKPQESSPKVAMGSTSRSMVYPGLLIAKGWKPWERKHSKVQVNTLSFDEMDRVVHYMNDGMHDRVAAKQGRSRVKSPHSWDDQNSITGKFTNNEFVARMMDHMADQDEPVDSNPRTRNSLRSGIGSKPETPPRIL